MNVVEQSHIWKQTLAEQGSGDVDPAHGFRSRLRQAFTKFRQRASVLAGEIPLELRHLTVHDMTHIDALWLMADMIVGPDYPITPTESFVLGGAFLLHDLGMALASYAAGMAELERDPSWQDATVQLFRRKHGRSPSTKDMGSLDPEIRQGATEELLRLKHAQHAEDLATIAYRHTDRDLAYHLIEDEELRQNYGHLIGRIAYSHWWSAEELPNHFSKMIGGFPRQPWRMADRSPETCPHRPGGRRMPTGCPASAGFSPRAPQADRGV